MKCYKYIAILGGLNIIFAIGIFYVLEICNVISFEMAYFSTFLVVMSSYLSLKGKLKQETQKNLDLSLQDDRGQKPHQVHRFSKFMLGLKLSLGLYRIFAYVALAIGVVVLMEYQYFRIVGYVLGIIVCLASIVLFKIKHLD